MALGLAHPQSELDGNSSLASTESSSGSSEQSGGFDTAMTELEIDYESLPTDRLSTHMMAGAAAGMMEHCVMYPVDCVKVRIDIYLYIATVCMMVCLCFNVLWPASVVCVQDIG